MKNQESQRVITLEDLLRLKRAERPPAEFWEQFDRELRVKQLAALVEKRPWWKLALPRASSIVARYYLPLGAGAVFAIAFVTMHKPAGAPLAGSRPDLVAMASPDRVQPDGMVTPVAYTAATASLAPAPQDDMSLTVAEDATPAPDAALDDSTSIFATLHGVEEPTPSARFIAANLAAVQAADPTLAATFQKSARGAEARIVQAVEPLAMISPSEARIARINSPMVAAFAKDNFSRTSDRIARRLSEARMREETRRFGATGNSLAVSF